MWDWKGAATWHKSPYTQPWVHVPTWGNQSQASKGVTEQDAETPAMEEAGCRDTTLYTQLSPPRSGSNAKNNPMPHSFSIRWEHSLSVLYSYCATTTNSLGSLQGRRGYGDKASTDEATALPAFGRCCISREEFGSDTGWQRGGSAQTFLRRSAKTSRGGCICSLVKRKKKSSRKARKLSREEAGLMERKESSSTVGTVPPRHAPTTMQEATAARGEGPESCILPGDRSWSGGRG